MKIKKNVMMAALSFSVAINLNGCVYGPPFDPSDNVLQGAYGPPPEEYREIEDSTDSDNDNSDSEASFVSEDINGTGE